MALKRRFVSLDWVIKQILKKRMDFEILEGFLSELLMQDIHIKGLLESETNKKDSNDKHNKVDLLVESGNNEYIIIEVQYDTEMDFLQRILYGVAKLLTETLEAGMQYGEIKKIISISIVYFDMGAGEDYLYKGTTTFIGLNKHDILKLNSIQQELYKTEKISDIYPEYYLIKVNKFDNITRNRIDEWIYFLKNEEIKDGFMAKGLMKAKEELDILKLSPAERQEYEDYQESLHYNASMFHSSYGTGLIEGEKKGRKEGREEGIDEGKKEGKRETAIELLKRGVDIDIVSAATGFEKEDLIQLTQNDL